MPNNNQRKTVARRNKNKSSNSKFTDRKPNMVILSRPGEIMFPPRLRTSGRVALNSQLVFSSNANQYQYLDINNPITVASSQNMSGLAWLISGQQTNGSSYAPYVLGIVRKAMIEVYAKTSASPNAGTAALVALYPLSPGTSVSTLSLTQAEEQFGRSNIIELPEGLETVARSKPLIKKSYNIWDLFGVTEETYMNNYSLYSFGYAGLLSGVPAVDLCLQVGTENAATDTSYQVRTNIIVTLEIEFFNRNQLIASGPHA
jgi:hypothetical protein